MWSLTLDNFLVALPARFWIGRPSICIPHTSTSLSGSFIDGYVGTTSINQHRFSSHEGHHLASTILLFSLETPMLALAWWMYVAVATCFGGLLLRPLCLRTLALTHASLLAKFLPLQRCHKSVICVETGRTCERTIADAPQRLH